MTDHLGNLLACPLNRKFILDRVYWALYSNYEDRTEENWQARETVCRLLREI